MGVKSLRRTVVYCQVFLRRRLVLLLGVVAPVLLPYLHSSRRSPRDYLNPRDPMEILICLI